MIFLEALLVLTIFSALRDIIMKKILGHVDADVVAGASGFFIALLSVPFILWQGIPESVYSFSFLGVVLLGGGFYAAGKFFSFTAYQLGDISYINPLKGLVTIISIVSGFLLFGDLPTFWGYVGIFSIFAGVYMLNFKDKSLGVFEPILALFHNPASKIYMFSVLLYGFTVAFDKLGSSLSSPLIWVFFLNLSLVFVSIKNIYKRGWGEMKTLRIYKWYFLAGNTLQFIVLWFHFYVLQHMQVAYVSSFKSSAIFVSVLIGGFLFHEKDLKNRVIASLIILSGILVIIFSETLL